MPDAVASLLNTGKVQLFTADSIDAECLRTGDVSPRRRAALRQKVILLPRPASWLPASGS